MRVALAFELRFVLASLVFQSQGLQKFFWSSLPPYAAAEPLPADLLPASTCWHGGLTLLLRPRTVQQQSLPALPPGRFGRGLIRSLLFTSNLTGFAVTQFLFHGFNRSF